ncbi:hypothetical protein LV84_00052 [Algoriphagus ratkowskyi]|uniref:Outer membrane lipoprotein-sorting protein n=1 Tax=Algoriphagus ratkowskyi TaxID=57028 RepID=A0A2W7RL00_9BACT|nr:DUF6503 family protein [Algoriphagus ratkowskyi]PZX61064.1 hypothetical protein LV84_00052 [Algoriphagus ratkowskyi]TXD79199.1 hypothetical protein ESW18_02890 [Algoriphagus ratkowskyi]
MNFRLLQTFALSLLIFACSPSPEKQAQELIEKSVEAHQISKKWDKVSNIKFKKWTRLMNESGEIESESDQWVEFRLKPYFEAKLIWTKDSILHVVNFNGSKTSYQMGENSIQNEGFLKAKRTEIDAAYFAFAQPWNLIDEDANLAYEGQKTLEGGKTIESIRVDYGPESDVWWFYFDPVSAQIVANELHAKDHKSLIENLSYDESSGLIFAKERKSYRIDESGEKLYLRAEYLYSDYEVTFE